jgi:hypothetical protein
VRGDYGGGNGKRCSGDYGEAVAKFFGGRVGSEHVVVLDSKLRSLVRTTRRRNLAALVESNADAG